MTSQETAEQELRRRILTELETDDLGLWSVVLKARQILRAGPGEVQSIVLSVLAQLMDSQEVAIGFPTEDGTGFVAWRMSPQAAIRRIELEWSDLGRDPDIGEIAWLARASRQ